MKCSVKLTYTCITFVVCFLLRRLFVACHFYEMHNFFLQQATGDLEIL